jgi:hypothetical protein
MSGTLVRVMVQDIWHELPLTAAPGSTFAQLKQAALTAATVRRPAAEYVLKLRGVEVTDEAQTLDAAKVPANAPFIVLPARRRPVK